MSKFVDFRSESAKQNERRAQTSLDAADEKVAKELVALAVQLDSLDYKTEPFKALAKKVKEIGEVLCKAGGSNRMDLICYRVGVLHGSTSHVRLNWDGVCGWQF